MHIYKQRFEAGGEHTGGDLPAMVRVDGVLYQLDMDTVGESDSARVEVLGTIKTQVSYSETPSEDDQANYPGVGRQYGMLDGQLVIKDKDGNWKYTLANLSKDEVSAAVIAYMAPGWADICAYQRCRQGMLVTAKRTNEDASLDAILMLAQKVDGEIQITQMETGRVDDDAGYGVFQTHMAGQTIVFGIADRRMRETGSAEMTSVSFSSVTLRFSEGSTNTALSADPGETFVTGVYGDAEITSVRLNLGSSGDVAIFTDIPTAGEDGLATMTLAGNFADAAVEERSEPALSEKERQTIRQAVFDKFTTAQWDWENLTEDEIRSFSRRGFLRERHGRKLSELLRRVCRLLCPDRQSTKRESDMDTLAPGRADSGAFHRRRRRNHAAALLLAQ